jgi:LAO/AO transport system kinase
MSGQNSKDLAAKNAAERIRLKRSESSTAEFLLTQIRNGSRSALGQAITLLESSKQDDKVLADELLQAALPFSGNSIRVGITGVPGVGKSTFIEALGSKLIANGKKLAVLAIDPSSQKSKGSILGDKTRMEKLSSSESAFIRPSPSSEALGGVARKTREAIILCEAAGYDTIFVETVGVGQSEIAVKAMVDCFLLLMLAGAGDELQGIKRGIMEMADIMAITKSDGENTKMSKIARSSYSNALHLFPPTESGWIPEVLTCSAYEMKGIDEVWNCVEKYRSHMTVKGFFESHRHEQDVNWFRETIQMNLLNQFYSNAEIKKAIPAYESKIRDGKITPFLAANEILKLF